MRFFAILFMVGALFAQTAKYPGAIATDQDLGKAKDRSASTLSAGIDAATLSVPVADGTKFTAYEIITIDDEQMIVCNIVANTLTICAGTRGFDWTDPATHLINAAVRGQVTAWNFNALAAEVKAIETALGINLASIAIAASQVTSGTFLAARVQEVLALADLTDVTAKTGTGTTAVMSVTPSLTTPVIGAYTVATLPAAGTINRVAIVTDALTAGSCTSGGGSARSWCRDTGAAWEPLGDGGAGGGTPGGSDTQIQYNNAGAFGGTSGFTWSLADGRITFTNPPPLDATKAAWLLGNWLSGGSAQGTYIGANPDSFSGDCLRFQVAGSNYLYLSCSGSGLLWAKNIESDGYIKLGGSNMVSFSGRSEIHSPSNGWIRITSLNAAARASLDLKDLKHAAGTEGTCNVDNRGWIVNAHAGAAAKDTYRICRKDASEVYAWEDLIGGTGSDTHPSKVGKANYVLGVNAAADGEEWKNIVIGPTSALSVTHSLGQISLDIVTAIVPQKSAANTWTGLNTFDLGAQLTPMSAPGAPSDGRIWYDTDLAKFRCRQAGASVDCVGTGGGGLGDPGGNGVVVRTALDTTINRTITGTGNEVTVTNGDGVSGNPTLSLSGTFDISGKTSTKSCKTGTSAPGTCNVGECFMDTDGAAGQNLHLCTASNVWTPVGSPDYNSTYSWWVAPAALDCGSSAAQASTANTVYLYLRHLDIRQTFSSGSVYIDTAYASGNARVGVYSVSGGTCGDLLFQTTNISTTGTGAGTGTFGATQLAPGWYYVAYAVDNGTAAVRGCPASTSMNALRNAGTMKFIGTATNAASFPDTGLPASCGGMTATNTAQRGMLFHR